jgi:hypothetical protein
MSCLRGPSGPGIYARYSRCGGLSLSANVTDHTNWYYHVRA